MSVNIKISYKPMYMDNKWNYLVEVEGHPLLGNQIFVPDEYLKASNINIKEYIEGVAINNRRRIKINKKHLLRNW